MEIEQIPNIIPSEFIYQTEHKVYVDLDYYAERTQSLQKQVYFWAKDYNDLQNKNINLIEKLHDLNDVMNKQKERLLFISSCELPAKDVEYQELKNKYEELLKLNK
jgi:hypothetical protein